MQGSYSIIEVTMAAVVELFPLFSRLRLLRHWAGTVDICPDASPIISKTPIDGLYLCGAGTHPGGGVTGLCGFNAARRILRDRKPSTR